MSNDESKGVDPRTLLAAERTLLAWIRTGIALMGFGFVVARFGVFLHEMAGAAAQVQQQPIGGGAVTGVAVVGVGVLVNLWASLRHREMFRRLQRGDTDIGARGPVAIGLATGLGGIVVLGLLLHAVWR